jgi:hypothetical protein
LRAEATTAIEEMGGKGGRREGKGETGREEGDGRRKAEREGDGKEGVV